MSTESYEFDSTAPAGEAEKLVKRMSAGANLAQSGSIVSKDDKALKIATFSLQKYLQAPEFASEFLERGGLESLCEIIRKASGNTLAYALNSFLSLMAHAASWEALTTDFVSEVAHITATQTLVTICRPGTAILNQIVSNEAFGYATLHDVLQREPELLAILTQRLQSSDYTLCLNSLSLLTAMLKMVTDDHRSELLEGLEKAATRKGVLRLMNDHPSEELKEHLLEFQSALMINVQRRRKTQISVHNPRHAQMLEDIWNAALVADVHVSGARKWKKLGFATEVPHREFGRTGVFGLERMHAFATQQQDLFAEIILEQIHRPEPKRCPIAKASIEVTELLCSYWNINSGYSSAVFEPLLLNFDHIQSTTLQCFCRLFHDMEASTSDFSKVSALVRSQLRATLKSEGVKDIFEFDRVMLGTPYHVIRDRRLKELEWADDLLGREAIRNLRTRLNKQSYEFIKRQRINCLLRGAWFPCPLSSQRIVALATTNSNSSSQINTSASGSGSATSGNTATNALNAMTPSLPGSSSSNTGKRWRYYKLCPSKKVIQFGDFNDKIAPVIRNYEQLPYRLELDRDTVEIKPLGRKASMPIIQDLSFKLVSSASDDGGLQAAEFICSSSEQASEWKDGLSMLLDKGITSKDTAEYLHSLTEIGVRVKLLQIAGDRVEVPHGHVEAPPVPAGLGSGFFYQT
ncbi:ELMO/CED-12 family-domain-containing protein [Syncephalastrum racemosum]|uniref:ELMO/CED-12 family-domain-containing protein n=1 Tax=Syncephalastrum racemosum TaxID=13706 RepID=A0A1X2H5R7_SYNRA|nr:ELMO/CED-12 family-domain-containing protein [Syncephalastrum racemosum]